MLSRKIVLGFLAAAGAFLSLGSFLKKADATANPNPGAREIPSAPSPLFGAPLSTTIDDIYAKWGNRYGVDPDLLKAIATVESGENPSAFNPSDPSYGLMQILCRTGTDGFCANRFNIQSWDEATPERLRPQF